MKHLLTAEYFADNLPSVSTLAMAPWLTWAWAKGGDSVAFRAAGIKTMLYTNPNRQHPGGNMWTTDETTFAHTCKPLRIQFPTHNNIYLMNPASSHLSTLWKTAVANSGGQFDAIYDDTANNLGSPSPSLPCNFSQNVWSSNSNALIKSLGRPVIYNGLGNFGPGPTISTAIQLNPSTIGGMMELCYAAYDGNGTKPGANLWRSEEQTEIDMVAGGKLFICRGDNMANANQRIPNRLYMIGSFLLTFNPATTIISETFATPTKFGVEPEDELVPTAPLKSTPSTIAGLKQASGVYGREYGSCYLAGKLIGACAVVVNSDSTSEAFPWRTKYHHTLALSGGGILDGGTVSAAGPAPPAYVPALSSVISFL